MTKDSNGSSKKGYKTSHKVMYLDYEGDENKFPSWLKQFMQLCEVADVEEAFEDDFNCISKKEYKKGKKVTRTMNGEKVLVDGVPKEEDITKADKIAFKANQRAAMSLTFSMPDKYHTCMQQAQTGETQLAKEMLSAVKARIIPEDNDTYLSELLEKFRNCKPHTFKKTDTYKERLIEINDKLGVLDMSAKKSDKEIIIHVVGIVKDCKREGVPSQWDAFLGIVFPSSGLGVNQKGLRINGHVGVRQIFLV